MKKKDLGPISLTVFLSKVAEDCVVSSYVKPDYCGTKLINYASTNQYGPIRAKETDSNGTLFDCKNPSDLIMIHWGILIRKFNYSFINYSIIHWIIHLFTDRSQRFKLADGCFSEWGPFPLCVLEASS